MALSTGAVVLHLPFRVQNQDGYHSDQTPDKGACWRDVPCSVSRLLSGAGGHQPEGFRCGRPGPSEVLKGIREGNGSGT
jgi:hypothetical protein